MVPTYHATKLIAILVLIPLLLICSSSDSSGSISDANKTFDLVNEVHPIHRDCECPLYFVSTTLVTTDTTQWTPPRFAERRADRYQMVQSQIEPRGITDPAVLEAMRHVPRHLFVPGDLAENAYEDRPLPIGHGQTISQPFIVAYMTQALNIDSTDRVLEIGTGSGYQAAVLSEITPEVYTIEIVEPLARQARNRFDNLGYETIKTKIGNGYNGWKKYAPYDAIIVTAAPDQIPEALKKQLKPGGTMIIPVGAVHETQQLLRVRKEADGTITQDTLLPVRFVPMTGDPDS